MEYLDLYDDKGNVINKTIIRGDKNAVIGEHEHIAVAVIFIENNNGEFLIQKTSKEKGGLYSSTGGHIDSGETPLQAIRREVLEELGISINYDEIKSYGFLLYDMPIRFLFYINKDIDIKDIKVQSEEVDFVKYMSIDEINDLISNDLMLKSHGILFKELIKNK